MRIERKFSSTDVHKISDPDTREFLYKICKFLETATVTLSDLNFDEKTFSAAGSQTIRHSLGYKPKDAYVTYVSTGTASFNYGSFTDSEIVLTTTAPCTVRYVFGEHK